MYDVVVIGAGVIGCAVARELSKYKLKVLVLEKESDVCSGTSKANSGIIHAGFDAEPGTLKGELNAKANLMFDKLSEELEIPFKRNGSLVLCFDKKDMKILYDLMKRGEHNGVPDLQILSGDEVRTIEPNISDKVIAALYAPTGGIVCPFNLTIALAESANLNGVEFRFNSNVTNIKKDSNIFNIFINDEKIVTKMIINAAGLYSDVINNYISENKFTIHPKRGEYNLFDRYASDITKMTLFQLPSSQGKGVLVTPTIDGNIMVGPSAVDVEDKEDLSTTREGLDSIMDKALLMVKSLPKNLIITSFTGLRAKSDTNDFIIGEQDDAKGFINVAAIDSPGLTCSPMIALKVSEIVIDRLKAKRNNDFKANRQAIKRFSEMTIEEKREAVKYNPYYGNILCRCEMVTEAEVLEAINRPLGATDLDGIKRRTRAGSGRCQQGFCVTRLMEILSREKGIELVDITKCGRKSNILKGKLKEGF